MKIAAIDIGTNAVKAKVFNTSPSHIEFIESNILFLLELKKSKNIKK